MTVEERTTVRLLGWAVYAEHAHIVSRSRSVVIDLGPHGAKVPGFQFTRVRVIETVDAVTGEVSYSAEGFGVRLTRAGTIPKRQPASEWFPVPDQLAKDLFTHEHNKQRWGL